MKNRVELRNFIRYQLAQLGERNGEHEFELLAFELARARHVSNLQPATGPVKAGGDQGRDFESYHTYLRSSAIGRTTFSTLVSTDLVVGACTLNKKIASKIRADLKTIFGSGDKPDRVIYYCEPSIPVAKRHDLQEECQKTYGAKLDIFDGLAIADMLSDPDTFWIAEQYLGVPESFYPEGEVDEEYEALRQRWLTETREPRNYADFQSIKSGLRTATTEDAAKPEFSAWMGKMRLFLGDSYTPLARHRARYEIAAAEFKRGTLDQAIDPLKAYFDETQDFTRHPSDLLDAAVLVSFSFRAVFEKQTSLTVETVVSWRDQVISLVDSALKVASRQVDRLILMEADAMLRPYNFDLPLEQKQRNLVKAYLEIVRLARTVPYYPLPHLDKIVKLLSDFASDAPEFAELRDECDAIMSEKAGARTVSEKAFERASGHYRAGKILAAMDELHRAKVGAFTGEEVPQAVLLMLMLSECYTELKLHFAARYYAAGAMYLSFNSSQDSVYEMLPQTAFALARAHYMAGEGASAVLLAKPAIFAHSHFAEDPGNAEKHEDLQSTLADISVTYTLAKRFAPHVVKVLDDSINEWPFQRNVIDQYLAIANSPRSPWASMSFTELEDRSEAELGVLPFQDLGGRRTVHWMALGIEWTVEFASDRSTLATIHGLLATLQVVQGEFASADLNIIPTKVLMQVEVATVANMAIRSEADNEALKWRVTLPMQRKEPATIDNAILDGLAIVVEIIGHATALQVQTYSEQIEVLFKRGLKSRIFSVRPTEELMDFVLEQMDGGEKLTAVTPPRPTRPIRPKEPNELAWRSGPGPGYSDEKAKQILGNRYRVNTQAIRLSLPRIMEDPRGRAWILKSRQQGLLDWCVLGILTNAVCAYQVEKGLGRLIRPTDTEVFRTRLFRAEEETDATFDISTLTDDLFDAQWRVMLMAVANTWGLISHVQTPVFEGFRRVLDERYGFSTDDIPHDDPFVGLGE